MRALNIIVGAGFFVGAVVAGSREWNGRTQRPDPQPPPANETAREDHAPPPGNGGAGQGQPPAEAVGVAFGVENHADREVTFLVDPEFHTIALFTYPRSRTPILAPGDIQQFSIPPGPYQLLVDGCPRGDVIAVTPDREWRLGFFAGPPGEPPVARLEASGGVVFQTVLRTEAPPTIVYVCPLHPDVRFLSPCDCPYCHVHLVVVRPAVVYVCPRHPHVRLEAGGVCPECQTQLVVQMNFSFGDRRERTHVDPLGPEGGTHAEKAGRVEHQAEPTKQEELAPPAQPAQPPELPKTPPKEKPKEPPKEEPKQPPQEPPPQPPQPEQPPQEPPPQPPKEKPKQPPEEKPKEDPDAPPKEKKPKKHPKDEQPRAALPWEERMGIR